MEAKTKQPVIMRIRNNGDGRTMEDYMKFWWLAYVNGFDMKRHCQASLLGYKNAPNRKVRLSMPLGVVTVLDEADYKHLYLCGVSYTSWSDNFHLAMEYAAGATIEKTSPDGRFTVIVNNARELEIPPLPDGYAGYPREYTTCRNWQFGVRYYTDHDEPVLPIDHTKSLARAKTSKSLAEKAARHKVIRGGECFWFVFSGNSGRRSIVTKRDIDGQAIYNCSCRYGSFKAIDENCACSHVLAVLQHEQKTAMQTQQTLI